MNSKHLIIMVIILCAAVFGKDTQQSIFIQEWLVAGPFDAKLPVVISEKDQNAELKDLLLLEEVCLKEIYPAENEKITIGQQTLSWTKSVTAHNNTIILSETSLSDNNIWFMVSYLQTPAFFKGTIELSSNHLFSVFIDGKKIDAKMTSDQDKTGKISHQITLEQGKHIILVKLLNDSELNKHVSVQCEIQPDINTITTTMNPGKFMTIENLLFSPKISNISLSHDGQITAVSCSHASRDGSDSWTDLIHTKDGSLLQSFKGGMDISGIQWSPVSHQFIYSQTKDDKTTLWLYNPDSGSSVALKEDIENFSSFTWDKNGEFIIYQTTKMPDADEVGIKKIEGMTDRWPQWRGYSHFYKLDLNSRSCKKILEGQYLLSVLDIHPDGKSLLIYEYKQNFTEHPPYLEKIYTLNLQSMQLDSLFSGFWLRSVQWSPDGKKILVHAGPSVFGKTGQNVKSGQIPIEHDGQLYIFNPQTNNVEPITKNFKPSVNSASWSSDQKHIFLNVTERSYKVLYQYNIKKKEFLKLNTGIDVLKKIDFAKEANKAVYYGSSANVPPKAYFIDINKNRSKLISDPAKDVYQHIKFGDVERWTFINERGVEIEGRIYFPPGFDKTRKYPLIVYYYGGVNPVERDFGGRYPKNYYAANGYVIYVLQPSGCVGFGQEFSALHNNDWGKIVADEIIDGVTQFLDKNEFIDRSKVGCIGASYGGFMTMLLQTRTDIFTAAISHAGISSISGYWGEGYWGYIYNSMSAAFSYPWNRRDIYVDQSALYHADKINTPLLLLHGSDDTNVPPGESRQMYTALKTLGKEVELIEISDQNHWIMQPLKREKWTKTIVAWFNKYLRKDPSWWNELYSGKKGE